MASRKSPVVVFPKIKEVRTFLIQGVGSGGGMLVPRCMRLSNSHLSVVKITTMSPEATG